MYDSRANNQRNDIPIGWRNEAAGVYNFLKIFIF